MAPQLPNAPPHPTPPHKAQCKLLSHALSLFASPSLGTTWQVSCDSLYCVITHNSKGSSSFRHSTERRSWNQRKLQLAPQHAKLQLLTCTYVMAPLPPSSELTAPDGTDAADGAGSVHQTWLQLPLTPWRQSLDRANCPLRQSRTTCLE